MASRSGLVWFSCMYDGLRRDGLMGVYGMRYSEHFVYVISLAALQGTGLYMILWRACFQGAVFKSVCMSSLCELAVASLATSSLGAAKNEAKLQAYRAQSQLQLFFNTTTHQCRSRLSYSPLSSQVIEAAVKDERKT